MESDIIKSTKLIAMKTLALMSVIIPLFYGIASAQIQMESFDLDDPQLWVSPTGPHLIVIIDSIDYELVCLSHADTVSQATIWVYNIDPSWIKAVSTLSNSEALEKHGYKGVDHVRIIRLFKDNIEDFLEGKIVDTPLKIVSYN